MGGRERLRSKRTGGWLRISKPRTGSYAAVFTATVVTDNWRRCGWESCDQGIDVILQVGKAPVASVAEFEAALKGLKRGDRVRLLVRNGQSTGLVELVVS